MQDILWDPYREKRMNERKIFKDIQSTALS